MSMFQMIKELAMSVFIGGLAAASWVIPMTDLLYRFQFTAKHILAGNKINAEFMKLHEHKSGTPSMGGILIWITVPVILLILFWNIPFVRAVSFMFLLVGGYGFLDGLLDMATKNNQKFREFTARFEWKVVKLLVTLIINVIVALLIVYVAGLHTVNIFGYNFALDNIFGIAFLSILSLISLYCTEIIDGLDGLSAGLFIITLAGFILLAVALPAQFSIGASTTVLSVIGVVVGVLIVYLYFNIPPARFFMGGPGAMPMGPFFLMLSILGNVFPAFLVLMIIYFVDLCSSAIQLTSIRFFKRKVFKIAPIHHHFEAIGWPEYKVVMRFWLFNGAIVFLAILIQLFINS